MNNRLNPHWELTAEVLGNDVARMLFVSPKKLILGVWMADLEISNRFSVSDAITAVDGAPYVGDSQIGGFLRSFAEIDMLDRLDEPELRFQRYEKLDHEAWAIFQSAKTAFEGLMQQRPSL